MLLAFAIPMVGMRPVNLCLLELCFLAYTDMPTVQKNKGGGYAVTFGFFLSRLFSTCSDFGRHKEAFLVSVVGWEGVVLEPWVSLLLQLSTSFFLVCWLCFLLHFQVFSLKSELRITNGQLNSAVLTLFSFRVPLEAFSQDTSGSLGFCLWQTQVLYINAISLTTHQVGAEASIPAFWHFPAPVATLWWNVFVNLALFRYHTGQLLAVILRPYWISYLHMLQIVAVLELYISVLSKVLLSLDCPGFRSRRYN